MSLLCVCVITSHMALRLDTRSDDDDDGGGEADGSKSHRSLDEVMRFH